MRKYRNCPKTIDGHRFASQKEAQRYAELKILLDQRQISDLVLQLRYALRCEGGAKVSTYVADFVYIEHGKRVIEDCKGFRTPLYKLKRKWMKAQYGIEIRET